MILDLFAGVGVGLALRDMGLTEVGIDDDPAVATVRAQYGLATIRADVATWALEPLVGRVDGIWASPPCTDWSKAGRRAGLEGLSGALVREVPRWVHALRPEWVCCEQVPECVGFWREYAWDFATLGYSCWTGVVDAARFGTPQHRRRAILIASRVREVRAPEPTHGDPARDLFGHQLAPLVSMAEALGWGADEPTPTVCGARVPRWVYARHGESPRFSPERPARTVTGSVGKTEWMVDRRFSQATEAGGTRRDWPASEPAPTVTGEAGCQAPWLRHPGRSYGLEALTPTDVPAPTVDLGHNQGAWCWECPATTVQSTDPVPVTIPELCILQDLPPDLFEGLKLTKTAKSRIVGNAVPASLVRAAVKAAT